MTGYARIRDDVAVIRVRFERIGRGPKFDTVLDTFREHFPRSTWDDDHKAWVLPRSRFLDVYRFCCALFGQANVRLERNDTTTAPWLQAGLFPPRET